MGTSLNKATLQIRIDKSLKEKTQKTLKLMGLDFTTAINIYFNKINNDQAIPFQISVDGFYSDYNKEFLIKSIKQAKEGKVVIKTIEELEALENE